METLPVYLSPELELDKYHPDNHDFMKSKRRYENLLVTQQQKCKPRHVRIAKDHHLGLPTAEIAKRNNVHPTTVRAILHREEVQNLTYLLGRYDAHMSGPTMEHRKHLIWQILVDNQQDDPTVALRANDQINKMEGIYVQKVDANLHIQIDSQLFPKGALDNG